MPLTPAILKRLQGVQRAGEGWLAFCPAHRDRESRSLSVSQTLDRTLLHCFVGCTAEKIVSAAGMTMAALFTENASSPDGSGSTGNADRTALTLEAFAEAKRLPVSFLLEQGVVEDSRGLRITYRLADGTEAPRQRRRTALAAKDGSSWDGPRRESPVAYGLWRLDDASDLGELWLVEGETDALTGWLHNLAVLGIPGANMTKVITADALRGLARLWILEEPDGGGSTFVDGCEKRLAELCFAGETRVVCLPTKDLNDLHRGVGQGFAGALAQAQAAARLLGAGPGTEPASAYLETITTFLAEDDPPLSMIFPDLLPAGVIMLVHGEPRARKSLVGFELALAAATGTAPFGLGRFTPSEKIPVLYVQEEDPRSLTRPRLRRLVQERCSATAPDALYVSVRRGVDLDDPEWVEMIIQDCTRLEIRLLVLDAARRLSTKTDEGPAKVRELIAALRSIVTRAGISIAIVHHDIKPPQNGQDQRRRSQRASGGDWFAGCECPVHIERVNDRESLVYPQDYKFSADPAPFTFSCHLDDRLIRRLVGRDTTPDLAETAGARGKLLEWLRGNGPATKTAMKKAGFRWDTITVLLEGLLREGLVDEAPGRTVKSPLYFVVGEPSSESGNGSPPVRGDAP